MRLPFKFVDENTDLSTARLTGWDAVVGDTPVDVYLVPDHYHTHGSRDGANDYWYCPHGETPTHLNLTPFSGHACNWGITAEEVNTYRPGNGHHKDPEARRGLRCWITRNGEKFCSVQFGWTLDKALPAAQTMLTRLQEHALCLSHRDWKNKAIGRKVFYRGQPAIIERFRPDGGLYLVPDGIEHFTPGGAPQRTPEEVVEWQWEYGKGLWAELLSDSIWWFREDGP